MKKAFLTSIFIGSAFYRAIAAPLDFVFEDELLSKENKTAITNDLSILYKSTFEQESVIQFYSIEQTNSQFIGYLSSSRSGTWPDWKKVKKVVRNANAEPVLWISKDDSTWYTNHFAVLELHPHLYPSMCTFIEKLNTEGRQGALTDREAFDIEMVRESVQFSPGKPYSRSLKQAISTLKIYPSAKALIRIFPAENHPTGTVLADGIRLTNKPGNQTPNFMGFMIDYDSESDQHSNLPMIHYKGKWHLFYPDSLQDLIE